LKKRWYRIASLLSSLLALLLLLPCGYPIRAAEALILEIPLISSIEYTSKDKNPTVEETAAAQAALRSISQTAYDAFLMDHPLESMWIDIRASHISVTATSHNGAGNVYHWKIKTLKNQMFVRSEFTDPAGMTERLQRVVDRFTPTGETLYEKVLSIHDFVCATTVYDIEGNYVYSAYGALVDKRSVCEGYAEAFKLLCDRNGIACILVSGTGITSSGEENHMWNYVLMDDGQWYAVDTTWDDGREILRSYFLVGTDTVVNTRNGKLFSENHKPNGDISHTDLKRFDYPTLAVNAYEITPLSTPATDTSETEDAVSSEQVSVSEDHTSVGEENTDLPLQSVDAAANGSFTQRSSVNGWFYDQLDAEQQNFYDHLLAVSPPKGETVTEDSTPGEENTDMGTTLVTTVTDPITTPKPSASSASGIATSGIATEDENDTTSSTADKTTVTTPPSASDTTLTEDSTTVPNGQIFTDDLTVSLKGPPESAPDSSPVTPGERGIAIGHILRVMVIALALLTFFAFIILTVIRFDHSQPQ